MDIPLVFEIFGQQIPAHLFFEILAFLLAYQYYRVLRKNSNDKISSNNRLNIMIGAAVGAWLGSRFMAFLENPILPDKQLLWQLLNIKTIMGGLFGGLLGVELMKKLIGVKQSSGDLFTLPIIVGIFIGRIGCFLAGISEFTYGIPTEFFTGIDLGDGFKRHPLALYELLFLPMLFIGLKNVSSKRHLESGELFKIFMITYFSFRFFIEFLKPNKFYFLGLSSIQWLCIICLLYYSLYIYKKIVNASKKIHLL